MTRLALVAFLAAALAVACTALGPEPKRVKTQRELPPNTERHGYWIVCKKGYVTEPDTRGCVPPLPTGVNPTTIVEIPNSSGKWGAPGSEKGDDLGGCCSAHGGVSSTEDGRVICNDGSVDASCSLPE